MNPVSEVPIRRLAVLAGPPEAGSGMIWSRHIHGRAARERRELAARPKLVALVCPPEAPALTRAA